MRRSPRPRGPPLGELSGHSASRGTPGTGNESWIELFVENRNRDPANFQTFFQGSRVSVAHGEKYTMHGIGRGYSEPTRDRPRSNHRKLPDGTTGTPTNNRQTVRYFCPKRCSTSGSLILLYPSSRTESYTPFAQLEK